MSTPKVAKFYDDQFQKFTSPSLGTNEQFVEIDPRRFSIDSFSRNPESGQIDYKYNRFTTISENEIEEPCVGQKSLVSGDNAQRQVTKADAERRLTQIQDRNKLTKPHLKSSYALENLPVDNSAQSETLIKGVLTENRDINSRMSLGHGVLKRKMNEDRSKSPNKTPVKQQASKSSRFNNTKL